MAHSVLIAAADQTIGYELRAQVEELENFVVNDVADSTTRLNELIARHDPEIVVAHEQIGPVPILQAVREIVARRPGTAVVLLGEDLSPEVYAAAMDAGVRGVLPYPTSHEDLQTRLEAVAEWVGQMRSHLSSDSQKGDFSTRGRLVTVSGSKGGVGTTTIAAHLAHHAVTLVPGRSVCLIDLNLDNGDLGDFLGITHRLDVSDLAKVADDLSAQTVGSAIHRSTSGLSAVLGPTRIEDIGEVGERETVLILAALRRQFDLVIADCGSSVTPASAAAVEAADEAVLITTPDLLALRGTHRTIERWKRVGAREVTAVKILLNKVSRDNDIQTDTAARLLPNAPLEITIPEAFKVLQRGLNHQDPGQIQAKAWWEHIGRLAVEVGAVPSTATRSPRKKEGRRSLFGNRRPVVQTAAAEEGQATVEFAGLIGVVMLLMILLWQVALWGVSAAYTSHAADEAAREAGIGSPDAEVRAVALDAVPGWFRANMSVESSTGSVRVEGRLPMLFPSLTVDGMTFTSSTPIVREDR